MPNGDVPDSNIFAPSKLKKKKTCESVCKNPNLHYWAGLFQSYFDHAWLDMAKFLDHTNSHNLIHTHLKFFFFFNSLNHRGTGTIALGIVDCDMKIV